MDYVPTPFPLTLPGITCHLDDSDSQKLGELLSEHRVFRPLSHYSRIVCEVESALYTLHCASSDGDYPRPTLTIKPSCQFSYTVIIPASIASVG
jgi:hypothetical protein